MSKTVATCIAETNLVQGEPQENVFFLTLSRKIEDFPNEFLRTARSTSPIQICAIFSTIGPDNLAAVLNLELNAELEKIAAACSNQAVLDFEGFANQVINTLNVKVCNFAANKGTQFKTSMSMFVIEGDILRVIHVGITKAVLFRNNRIMLLTEEQTVAHRYVQMGAIQPGEELTHPENMNLTQYLGKMPQEGPVNADKKVHLKLQDNDELFLMGVGLSRKLPSQMRNSIIAKPLSTEIKSKEIINAAVSYGLKSGLTLIDIKVESTFLLPGDAVINSNLKTEAPVATRPGNAAKAQSNAFTDFDNSSDSSDTINYVPGSATLGLADMDDDEPIVNEQKEKIKTIIIPIVIFIVCILLGFGVTFMIFNMKDLISFTEPTTFLTDASGSVLYAASDMTPVYSQASLDATVIGTLNRGDVVTLQEVTDNTFSKVVTANNVTGYVLSAQLLEEDPTYFDETTEMTGDPTPVPTTDTMPTTESTTHMTTTAVQTDQIWNTKATTTTTTTVDPNTVEPGESDQTAPTSSSSDTSATNNGGDNGGNGGGDNGGNGGGDNGGNGGGDNGGNGGGDNGGNGGGDNGGNGGGDNGGNGGGDNGGNGGGDNGGNGGGDNGGNGGGDNGGNGGGDNGGGDAQAE